MSAVCMECSETDFTEQDLADGFHTRISYLPIPRHDSRCSGGPECERLCPVAEPEGPVQCGPIETVVGT